MTKPVASCTQPTLCTGCGAVGSIFPHCRGGSPNRSDHGFDAGKDHRHNGHRGQKSLQVYGLTDDGAGNLYALAEDPQSHCLELYKTATGEEGFGNRFELVFLTQATPGFPHV